MFKNFTPFVSATAFANSAIDATERFADQAVKYVPETVREHTAQFNQAYFSIVRANAAAASNLLDQVTRSFAK